MLNGHLRQQKSSLGMKDDEEPVAANFNFVRLDGLERGQQRYLQTEVLELIFAGGCKTGIFYGGAGGTPHNRFA